MRSPAPPFDLRTALTNELNAALSDLVSGDDASVHKTRVRLRRARALGRVGKTAAPGLASVFNETARTVMRQLGRSRDVAALADTARLLAETVDAKSAAALVRLAGDIEREIKQRPEIDLDKARAGIRDLLALAQVWPSPSARQIRVGAKQVAKRARAAYRRARGREDSVVRHEWRKREKDRLCAVKLLGDAWPRQRRRKRNQLLCQALGRERDALLLLEHLSAEPSGVEKAESAERAARAVRKRYRRWRQRCDSIGQTMHDGGA